MLTKEQNERLCLIGPGTPMGEVFRRYWHPVAASCELDDEPTKLVTILGETLVLYRDRQGRLGLIDQHCVHRRACLLFGIPERDGLRCIYHGWMYDHTGSCIDQPNEDMGGHAETFKSKTRIKAYPVRELGGLIFAYMGPEPAPLLPRWEPLVIENAERSIGRTLLPCNWLQVMENSLDQTHIEWLHSYFDNYAVERAGRPDWKHPVRHHKKIDNDLFEFGIIKRRVWEGGSEEDASWAIGHPILWPNLLSAVRGRLEIRVPVDDTHTLNYFYSAHLQPIDGPPYKQDRVPFFEAPLPGVDERGRPQWDRLINNSGQDIIAIYTQGPIADRSQEHLGTADTGIILYRKLMNESMDKVARGEDPFGIIRDPAKNVCIHIPTEDDGGAKGGRLGINDSRNTGDRPPGGLADMYDPRLADKTGQDMSRLARAGYLALADRERADREQADRERADTAALPSS